MDVEWHVYNGVYLEDKILNQGGYVVYEEVRQNEQVGPLLQQVGQLLGVIQAASELQRAAVGVYYLVRPLTRLGDAQDARHRRLGTRYSLAL